MATSSSETDVLPVEFGAGYIVPYSDIKHGSATLGDNGRILQGSRAIRTNQ